MKKLTFILSSVILITVSIALLSAISDNSHKMVAKKPMTINAYTATSNPTSDNIYVHLWNANHDYNWTVPPGTPANTVLGAIADECGYAVTLSSANPHTMQLYWFYASSTTSATSTGGMCLTCGSCPSLRIYN